MDIVKDHQEITIGKYKCKVQNVYKDWFCTVSGAENVVIFTQFGITYEQIENLLGYSCSGIFPQCKSAEDLTKVIEFIMSKDPANQQKTMQKVDRDYLIKLDNVKQADEVFAVLESLKEPVRRSTFIYNPNWCYVGFYTNTDNWTISNGGDNFGSNVISFENFMNTFSSKVSVKKVEESPVVDMEEIQAECKRRFPIGCKYQDSSDKSARVLKQDYSTYNIYGEKHVYAHEGGGCLYKDGKYAKLVSMPETSKDYIPEVGDYVVMERAGGWSFHHKNDGCIAIIENVGERTINSKPILCINGKLINPNVDDYVNFKHIPIRNNEGKVVFRKALPHEIPSQKSVTTEWEIGTYAVGLKGNFCVFSGITKLVSVGKVYTLSRGVSITEDNIGVKESQYWVKKDNVKWFARKEDAEAFASTLTKSSKEHVYAYVGDPLPTIKTKPLIEDVQSVSVNLRTKKNNNKFKF